MDIIEYKKEDYLDFVEFYNKILTESEHFKPYDEKLETKLFNAENRFKFIVRGEYNNIIAHLTFYSGEYNTYTIGVAVLKDFYGKHIGSKMLDFAENFLKDKQAREIIANINLNNWRSLLLFIKKGYKVVGDDKMLRLVKEL